MDVRQRCAGFTLIELVVVLAILGLLLALLPDALSVAIPGQQLRAAAYQLADDLKDARTRAILTGKSVEVPIGLSEGRTSGSPSRRLPRDTMIRIEDVPRRTFAGGQELVRFFPDGSASGGKINLSTGGRTYAISVDWLTGRVTVDD